MFGKSLRRPENASPAMTNASMGDLAVTVAVRGTPSMSDRETAVLALSISARDDLLQVLVDCPEGLCELRAVLIQQQEWRVREGIS
jgi:hypothetical protein